MFKRFYNDIPKINVSFVWCLFFSQLYKEFHRITNQNLAFSFFASLDRYTPHLLKLYKQKLMNELFNNTVLYIVAEPHKACFPCPKTQKDKKDVQAIRTAVLFGLALYLKEDASDIFKSCKVWRTPLGSSALPVLSAWTRMCVIWVRACGAVFTLCLPGACDQPPGGACPCAIKNRHFLNSREEGSKRTDCV